MSIQSKAPAVYKPTAQKVAAPPVYRPQQTSKSNVQLRPTSNFKLETRPEPAAYRPPQTGASAPCVAPKPLSANPPVRPQPQPESSQPPSSRTVQSKVPFKTLLAHQLAPATLTYRTQFPSRTIQRTVKPFLGEQGKRIEVLRADDRSVHLEIDSGDTVEDLKDYFARLLACDRESIVAYEWIGRDDPVDDFDRLVPSLIYRIKTLGEIMASKPSVVTFKGDDTEVYIDVYEASRQRRAWRRLTFSLARHWFPRLESEGKEKNSVMHYDVTKLDITQDCRDIADLLQLFWKDRRAPHEPESLQATCSSGRRYLIDTAGSSVLLNHFYVVEGTKVAAPLSADEYRFIREISLIKRALGDEQQALVMFAAIERKWNTRFAEMQGITGYDIRQIGALTREQRIQEHLDKAHEHRYIDDIKRFMTQNNLAALPSHFLTRALWSTVSSMDYDRASAAYDRLYHAGKLHFRGPDGQKELYQLDPPRVGSFGSVYYNED